MKKVTLETIKTALTNFGFADEDILSEIDKEINKGAEAKAKTAKGYEDAYDAIVGNLGDKPVTVKELYEAIKDDLPEGFTQGKVQYALTHLWQDKIVKVEGKPNGYRRAW